MAALVAPSTPASDSECEGFHEFVTFVSVDGDVGGTHEITRDIDWANPGAETEEPEVEWRIVEKSA